MENLIMGIKDHRSINKALIRLNKINVVGGVNGSGKSTASRILYTFLKTYSSDRWEVAVSDIINNINGIRDELIKGDIEDEANLFKELEYNDSYQEIIDSYLKLVEIVDNYLIYAETKKEEIASKMENVYDSLLNRLKNDFDNSFMIKHQNYITLSEKKFNERLHQIRLEFRDDSLEETDNSHTFDSSDAHFKVQFKSSCTKEFLSKNKIDLNDYDSYFDKIYKFDEEIENLKIDMYQNEMSILEFPIHFLFSENEDRSRYHVMKELLSRESLIDKGKLNFEFFIEISDSEYVLAKDYYKDNGSINDVFYFDNVSIFDLRDNTEDLMGFGKGRNIEHIEHILNTMSNLNEDDVPLDEKRIFVLEKINKILGGKFNVNKHTFPMSLNFSNNSFSTNDKNVISSGMKQIGIIQLLLWGNKLKEDTYLIIDEPEVNLHPDWQFKFAEILVLLAKELDVTVYLNSHSPFFIEAIDAFTEFYDMQCDINYYLTEESEVEGKYNFVKIESDELYKIYENLGNAYDLINQLRLRKRLEQ